MADNQETTRDEIIAMAVAAIAEQLGEKVSKLRVVRFREIRKSFLAQYLEEAKIPYEKFQLNR